MSETNGQMITTQELDSLAEHLPTNTTDPETRREMVLALLRHSEAPIERVEVQVVERKEEGGKKLPRYVLQKRWDVALRDWALAVVNQKNFEIVAAAWLFTLWAVWHWYGPTWWMLIWAPMPALSWWIRLPWRAASFLRVVTSGPVQDRYIQEEEIFAPQLVTAKTIIEERKAECEKCDQRYAFVQIGGKISWHCAACKCPPTGWSENDYRNGLEGFHCPLRKHPGPYPNDPQANSLMELGYEENAVLSAVGGGCTGCGCGKK